MKSMPDRVTKCVGTHVDLGLTCVRILAAQPIEE